MSCTNGRRLIALGFSFLLAGCSVNTAKMTNDELAKCATASGSYSKSNACYQEQVRRGVFKSSQATPVYNHDTEINYVNQYIGNNWIKVDTDVFAKATSHDKKTVSGWIKGKRKKQTVVSKFDLSCVSKTIRETESLAYDSSGSVVDRYENSYETYEDIVPDSVGEAVYFTMCNPQ
ncbi:hypothetical protein [Klebsiella aerogenes]|uniref:hypothetical protein n=1 Tax=Klebsiella aerogenes TaxID=548 RepID=UPI00351D0307